ncbi:hypothetical protein SDAV_002191 [Spiroplasma phoeniceum P40]|uniref:Uncharacterized protein n=2 Tax=Spiroplasma phoeniceum TaxID=47835 RepID=A0A345DSD3_9MOLU|nr:hypothetical protein SDAV_002191 [Spiroplasma phoeniceum P40]
MIIKHLTFQIHWCALQVYLFQIQKIWKNCGDLLNIIGDPSGATLVISKINYDEETKTYPYISATTVEAVANYKVKDNESGEWINGWDNLVKIINLMKPFLIEKGINEADIQTIKLLVELIWLIV